MNVLSCERSSGCESGWTTYLEQSFSSDVSFGKNSKQELLPVPDEEDLSMLSDASSGPPHFYEDDDNQHRYTVPKVATLNKNVGKRHKNKQRSRQTVDHQQLPSLLDDTASSPLINFSKTNTHASMEESGFHYPQGFSATHFQVQGGPALHDHFGFLQPSQSGNHLQGHQWF
ncbi:hypothetical protein like AT4G33800 [Hibiscus trionum]|uniref:Uncharacterized protein n=1 Tax=Hibiscus trionum TaxID=183268 RepID=A0A9W7MK47_HIBTR|nr:hypothetical protein like AT4G33800 [Hibiscus trionum]